MSTAAPAAPATTAGTAPGAAGTPGAGLGTEARLRIAAAVAVLASVAGLHTVVQGGAWFVQAVLAVAAVLLVAAAAAVLRLPAWLGVLAQLVALLVVLCVLFVPGQAVLGLLPGPQALGALADLVREGRQTIIGQTSPVPPEAGLRLLTTTGAGMTALVVDLVAVVARAPALTGPVLLAVHVVAVVFSPGGLPWGWFVLAAGGWALLLAADGAARTRAWGRPVHQRSGGPAGPTARGGSGGTGRTSVRLAAAGVAVVCAAAAVVLPTLVPGTSSAVIVAGNGQGIGGAAANSVNPLLDLRSDLESQGTAEVLRYTTSTTAPTPLRIVTVDVFDGQVWQPSDLSGASTQSLDDGVPAVPGYSPSTPSESVDYDITVEALRQQWLPVPYPPTSVDVSGRWVVDTSTLNIRAQGRTSTTQGQRYQVQQLAVAPTAEGLRDAAPTPTDVQERYTRLPQDLPPEIEQRAREVVGNETSPFLQAAALQDWFRSSGGFSYSLEAPEPRSASAIGDFLTQKTGYCVHFASAMALMARTLGIPARVAVGFLPGAQLGDGSWAVTLQDAHAWPELYFEGAGWVRFEPTPGSRTGSAPSWTVAPVAQLTPTTAPTGTAASSAAPSTSAASSAASTAGSAADQAPGAGGGSPWPALLVLALVVGALAAPLASRSLVRRRRWQRARGPGERAEAAWADLIEQLGDLGVSVSPAQTPRQVGRRLDAGLRSGDDGTSAQAPAVGRLVSAVEGARYGAGASGGTAVADRALAADVRAVVDGVVAQRPRSATWRWRLLPASGVGHLRRWTGRLVRPRRR